MIDILLDVSLILLFAGLVGSVAVGITDYWRKLMEDNTFTDVDEIYRAVDVWLEYHHYATISEARKDFCRYLGQPHLPAVMSIAGMWNLTEEQAHRMRLLLGPHARTVLKAYYARMHED